MEQPELKQEKGTKDKCYKIIQEIAVVKDLVCRGCGQARSECGHHLFKRDRLATAFLPEAVPGLCTRCHTGFAHGKDADKFKKRMVSQMGERYYELRRLSYTNVDHPDYNEIYQKLVCVLRAYRRGE